MQNTDKKTSVFKYDRSERQTVRLGEISDICTGKRNNQDKKNNGKYPFFVRSSIVEHIDTYSFDGEAILMPGEGNIGDIVHYVNGRFDYHQRVYKISSFPDNVNGRYIYHTLRASFKKWALGQTVKATVDSLRLPTFENFPVFLPPIKEQGRIAFALDSIETQIDAIENLLSKYEAIKKSTIFLLMKSKDGWTKRKLSDVCENFSGLTYTPENISTGGTLVLRSSNIQNEALSFDDNVFVDCKIPERATVKTGDLLVCVRNGSKKLIGKSAIISPDANGMAFGAFMTILRATSIDQRFLAYLWQSPAIQKQVGESLGATINQITNADIKRFEISCPNTIEEQNRIASKIFVLDEIIKNTQAQLVKAKGIKQGLMNYFFS